VRSESVEDADDLLVRGRSLRSTRLANLVNTLDPKLVAAALGIDPEGVMIYLADHVDTALLAQHRENAPGSGTA
jgi:hypothetical protein